MAKSRNRLQISFNDEIPHAVKEEHTSKSSSRELPMPKVVSDVLAAKCTSSTAKFLKRYYNVRDEYTPPAQSKISPTSLRTFSPDVVRDVFNHLEHGTPLFAPVQAKDPLAHVANEAPTTEIRLGK